MSLEEFVNKLYQFLVGAGSYSGNIIRVHTRKLDKLGDISFPLNTKNWHHLLDENERDGFTIFDHLSPESRNDRNTQLEKLIVESSKWLVQIHKCRVILDDNLHLFLSRPAVFQSTIELVIESKNTYGKCDIIQNYISVIVENTEAINTSLTTLRLTILRDVLTNLIQFTTKQNAPSQSCEIILTSNSKNKTNTIICGPVLNSRGLKDTDTTSSDLYSKRTSDMRMMAQHKYGVQVKPSTKWNEYFENLGKASITIEMLSNKPQKPSKITLHNLESSNKGASFIFYNCARLAALFREFDKRVSEKIYPELPSVQKISVDLLNQPEEWELMYVYILQFPMVVKGCIKDIGKGVVNPQNLVTFLSHLSSVFSVYYRRVRILTDPREHLFGVLHCRIYLLKALEQVFHNALFLLNIEPVKEM